MAGEPRKKHLEYKTGVDTGKYPSEFLRRRNTQRFNVCHNQDMCMCNPGLHNWGRLGILGQAQCTSQLFFLASSKHSLCLSSIKQGFKPGHKWMLSSTSFSEETLFNRDQVLWMMSLFCCQTTWKFHLPFSLRHLSVLSASYCHYLG